MPRMKDDPDFLDQVRSEVTDPRIWIDRIVVGLFALLAGLSVVLFTLVADAAELAYWLGQKPACTIVRQGRIHGVMP